MTKILSELKWPTLEQRRKETRLAMMFKIVNNNIELKLPSHVKYKQRRTRQYHPKKFIEVGSKSNSYKNSFVARTVKEWNLLPNSIIDSRSVAIFKSVYVNIFYS